jgi:hypothetical protein
MSAQKSTSSSSKNNRNKEMRTQKNFLKKVWINHNRSGGVKKRGITSAIRFVKKTEDGNFVVAVARAYNSSPQYCKSIGKKFAKDRMKRYFSLANFNKERYIFTQDYDSPKKFGDYELLPVFMVGPETILDESELIFWHNEVLPNIERQLRNS